MLKSFARRAFLRAAALGGLGSIGTFGAAGLLLPWSHALAASYPLQRRPKFSADPWSLGVASGYPAPGGVVLWILWGVLAIGLLR